MKNIINKLSYITLFTSIIISCQSKEEKQMNEGYSENIASDLYNSKWYLINKENNEYYYCTNGDQFFEINKDKIYDHTPMEDTTFSIDHKKEKGDKIFLYGDKKESFYYMIRWVDKNKGIISFQLNTYESNLFIIEKKLTSIKNKTCQPSTKSCEFKNLSNKYKFILEAEEYKNEKEQKYPTSAWIIVTNKKNGKSQEIHYEPNSWTSYQDLPCTNFFVKDFNFDGLEDFAIVWDQGGVEKLYEYYLQDKNGNFSALASFPLQHGILAENIDLVNKTITTQSIIGCCHININKYKLNSNTTWESSSEQHELKKK
ncbi:XAC2610-related protein [Chryseobacterium sp. SG20098]|uniref:XAC2610-related protein n=1 Tax=Chryseobacterium sp. SG20098 TaxID=3074145 RepID=UPI0028831786|nr:hypothetical protein [Chryseobacterium sp. SG20098]WNI36536.1 hypothetical protein RHP76_21725 [Chryseobacterium sp. SG20098]